MASLPVHRVIHSCSEVKERVGRSLLEALPAIDPSHGDLARGDQGPEQHRGGLGRGQSALGLDAPSELLMQAFDDFGCRATLIFLDAIQELPLKG